VEPFSSIRPFVVGITGSYSAGKTTIADLLVEQLSPRIAVVHLEVDHLGHRALEKVADRVIARFGSTISREGPDGRIGIDRKALGTIVFRDARALNDLEKIVHPVMVAEVDQIIEQAESGVVVLNAAILFKMGLDTRCDWILGVTAPALVRLFRALRRDALSLTQAWQRIRSQKKILPQLSTGNVDIRRVSNWGGKRNIHRKVETLVRELWKRIEALS